MSFISAAQHRAQLAALRSGDDAPDPSLPLAPAFDGAGRGDSVRHHSHSPEAGAPPPTPYFEGHHPHSPEVEAPPPTPSSEEEGAFDVSGDVSGEERRTVFTPQLKSRFLESLAEFGNVGQACKRGCVSRQTAYRERRRRPAFARMWDAALLAARTHAEGELAERAIHGVEEPVFYHGEEIGHRRRYSDRLLLAHLGRLDRIAERGDMAGALAALDDTIDALAQGEEIREEIYEEFGPEIRGEMGPEIGPEIKDVDAGENDPLDCVPHVPLGEVGGAQPAAPCVPRAPCPQCGGPCDEPFAQLEPEHCMFLENRLARMDAARPAGVKQPHELAKGVIAAGAIEEVQLDAFECGLDEWWAVTREEELDTRLRALERCGASAERAGEGGAVRQ